MLRCISDHKRRKCKGHLDGAKEEKEAKEEKGQ